MTSRGSSQPRRLMVTVHQGRGLANKDGMFGKNDVYCLLDLRPASGGGGGADADAAAEGGEQLRTTVVDEGGASPVWVGSESHVFSRPEHLEELVVDVCDHDDRTDDDLIGRCALDLREYRFEEEDVDWALEETWVQLKCAKGAKDTGEMQLSLKWAEPPVNFNETPASSALGLAGAAVGESPLFDYDSPEHDIKKQLAVREAEQDFREGEDPTTHVRDVRVTVMQAADLLKADTFGKNDPYVLLRVGDEELRTQVIQDGGRNVLFGVSRENPAGEALVFESCRHLRCTVQVWDDDGAVSKDDLIGEGTVWLPTLAESEASEANLEGRGGREVWVDLFSAPNKKGKTKAAGRVRVIMQTWDAAVQPPPVDMTGESTASSEEEEVTGEDVDEARRARLQERKAEKASASDDLKKALILEDEGIALAVRCERGSWGRPDIPGLIELLRDMPHCLNANVVGRACTAIAVVFDVDRMSRMQLDLPMHENDGIEVLCDAILRHSHSAVALEGGFAALERILRDDGPGPSHMWEPRIPTHSDSNYGIEDGYDGEDFTTPGEWGGALGAAGADYKEVMLAKKMDREARKVLSDYQGLACDSLIEERDSSEGFEGQHEGQQRSNKEQFLPVGSTGLNMLSARSVARSFLEVLGTATADELCQVVQEDGLAELGETLKKKKLSRALSPQKSRGASPDRHKTPDSDAAGDFDTKDDGPYTKDDGFWY